MPIKEEKMEFGRKLLILFFVVMVVTVVTVVHAQDDLDHKIAQMIMVGFAPGTDFVDTLYYDIENRNLGGVILFAYNLQNPRQIKLLTASLQKNAATPLIIATDQEGGIVARLDENNGFAETHTAYELGTVIDNEDSTRAQSRMMAEWLSVSGINTNLAPVVDVNVNPESPAIGYYGRSFSSDPMKVFQHADWFISEFENYNIICTLKHFPGHGSAMQDSHLGFTDITNTWADSELIPYRELISEGYADIVMAGHLYNAHLDSLFPASLSEKVITGLLRDSLGFQGVVASDAMFMKAITENYSFEEAIVLAINAGTDLLLYTTNEYEGHSLAAEVIRVVHRKINDGTIAESRIEESYARIMNLKSKITGLPAGSESNIPETFNIRIYPNPFNITTNIVFNIFKAGQVELQIYDIRGRRVLNRKYSWLPPGTYTVNFDATGLASGVYFLRAVVSGSARTAKMTLIK
jgi:beta-N-acetylhexosaminidase